MIEQFTKRWSDEILMMMSRDDEPASKYSEGAFCLNNEPMSSSNIFLFYPSYPMPAGKKLTAPLSCYEPLAIHYKEKHRISVIRGRGVHKLHSIKLFVKDLSENTDRDNFKSKVYRFNI